VGQTNLSNLVKGLTKKVSNSSLAIGIVYYCCCCCFEVGCVKLVVSLLGLLSCHMPFVKYGWQIYNSEKGITTISFSLLFFFFAFSFVQKI
jgi:hypothetical protein